MTNARMVREEIRKMAGRRVSFLAALFLPALFAVAVSVISIVLYEVKGNVHSIGGENILGYFAMGASVGALAFVVAAAQEGAWDTDHGTFRYLVMTGRSRASLYATRIAALVVLGLVSASLLAAVSLTHSALAPAADGSELTAKLAAEFVFGTVAFILFWAMVAHGLGTVLGSTAAATAFSFAIYFGTTLVGPFLSHFSRPARHLFPDDALGRLTGSDSATGSLLVAVLVIAAWVGGTMWAGYARLSHSEY